MHITRLLRLFVSVISLLLMPVDASALELPFVEHSAPINITFTNQDAKPLLAPKFEAALRKQQEERARVELETAPVKAAQQGKKILEKVLRSEGFYAGKVSYELSDEGEASYSITTGKQYLLRNVSIESTLDDLPSIKELGLVAGEPFRAADVLGAKSQLEQFLEKQHCLWRIEVDYAATVWHASNQADVILKVADSPEVTFSDITFTGQETIEADYLQDNVGVHEGECFKRSILDKARLHLFQLGLVSSVESTLTRSGDKVAVVFDITERKQRTVKAGAGYNSDEGLGISAGWEHRNIFGRAQKLEANGRFSELFRTANTTLTLPSFLRDEQTLIMRGEASDEELEAFNATSIMTSATLKRKLATYLSGSIGSKLKLSSVEELGDEETYGLLSFPVTLDYDRRDNVLDPKSGWMVSGEVAPFVDVLLASTSFLKATVGGSVYYTFPRMKWTPTLALRSAIGSINGQNTDDIPADERFYSGGGGSVRGYSFQTLGPLDGVHPMGGRSFAEISLETRLRFSENWGGVVFVDGGNAYDDTAPDFTQDFQWAYGAGVRYYTSFAPIRADIALPINPRSEIDNSFQLYVSIGQAF